MRARRQLWRVCSKCNAESVVDQELAVAAVSAAGVDREVLMPAVDEATSVERATTSQEVRVTRIMVKCAPGGWGEQIQLSAFGEMCYPSPWCAGKNNTCRPRDK